jgi:hypothetical protein
MSAFLVNGILNPQTNQLHQENYPADTSFICLAKSIRDYTLSFYYLNKQTRFYKIPKKEDAEKSALQQLAILSGIHFFF